MHLLYQTHVPCSSEIGRSPEKLQRMQLLPKYEFFGRMVILVNWDLRVYGSFHQDMSERLQSAAAVCFVEQDLFLLPITELLKEAGLSAPCPPVEKCPESAGSPPKPNTLQGKERHPQPCVCSLLLGNS